MATLFATRLESLMWCEQSVDIDVATDRNQPFSAVP
jgi:hypothetical protein